MNKKQLSRKFVALALGAASLAVVSTSGAVCFPEAPGVPGNSGEAPQWWSSAAPLGSAGTHWIDDARWAGASAFTEADDSVRFRGLMDTDGATRHLVLMWHVKSDASPASNDKLYFGLHDQTANKAIAFRVDMTISLPGESQAPSALNMYNFDGSNWALAGAVPAWLSSETKVDILPDGSWAVRTRVPITTSTTSTDQAIITTGANYGFFHQVQLDAASTSTPYSLPDGLSFVTDTSTGCALSPLCTSPANWRQFEDTNACEGQIALRPAHIYVGMPGNSQISVSSPNEIVAAPINNTTTGIAGNAIRGKFRLANWGSTIGVSPGWDELACVANDTEGYVPGSSALVPGPGGQFAMTCEWSVPDPSAYAAGGCTTDCKHYDQCVMVELAMAAGSSNTYEFSPQNARRNLQFVGASTVKKNAVVDIRGLKDGNPPRDVYLYVKTTNMPERFTDDTPTPFSRVNDDLSKKLARAKVRLPEGRSVGKETAAMIQRAMARGLITDDDVEVIMPTYTVYAWHDTGKTQGGKKVLAPQPSFTYVVHHDGPLEGWKHSLTAPGFNLTELLPNYYRLSVPKGGQASVVSTIRALEKPPCDCELTEIPEHEHDHHDHQYAKVDHKHHCACRFPGSTPGGTSSLGAILAAIVLAGLSWARRKRA